MTQKELHHTKNTF